MGFPCLSGTADEVACFSIAGIASAFNLGSTVYKDAALQLVASPLLHCAPLHTSFQYVENVQKSPGPFASRAAEVRGIALTEIIRVEIPFIPISACYPPKNGLAELLKPVGSLVARSQATTEELMNGYSLVLAVAKCLSRSKLKAGLAGFNIWNFYTEPPYIKHQGGYA